MINFKVNLINLEFLNLSLEPKDYPDVVLELLFSEACIYFLKRSEELLTF